MQAAMSDCNDCGHCVEMYTPTPEDPPQVNEVRIAINNWLNSILSSWTPSPYFLQ